MKKVLVFLLLSTSTMLFANGNDKERYCDQHPTSVVCSNDTLIIKDIQGEQGPTGPKGETGNTGAKGDKGDPGKDGKDGQSIQGNPGKDGANGIVDYSLIKNLAEQQTTYITDLAAGVSAGTNAMAGLDFGSTCKGTTEYGFAVGASDIDGTTGFAGALGVKHGFTNTTAVVVKAWAGSSNTKGGSAAMTFRF